MYCLLQVPVSIPWDENLFDGNDLGMLLQHVANKELSNDKHVFCTFCPTLEVSTYRDALKKAGYKNITPFYFEKDELPFCATNRACSSLETVFLVAFAGSAGKDMWHFDTTPDGEDNRMSVSLKHRLLNCNE